MPETVVPYTNGLYYENRPQVNIAPEDVLPISDTLGFHPNMGPIKQLWDEGKVAVINGIGYPHPNRSHFRSLDVWHTAQSEHIGQEGWLGKGIRELDPKVENADRVNLAVIFRGRCTPRACPWPR
jgi:uncharacterized protein (DUF1501 family)